MYWHFLLSFIKSRFLKTIWIRKKSFQHWSYAFLKMGCTQITNRWSLISKKFKNSKWKPMWANKIKSKNKLIALLHDRVVLLYPPEPPEETKFLMIQQLKYMDDNFTQEEINREWNIKIKKLKFKILCIVKCFKEIRKRFWILIFHMTNGNWKHEIWIKVVKCAQINIIIVLPPSGHKRTTKKTWKRCKIKTIM